MNSSALASGMSNGTTGTLPSLWPSAISLGTASGCFTRSMASRECGERSLGYAEVNCGLHHLGGFVLSIVAARAGHPSCNSTYPEEIWIPTGGASGWQGSKNGNRR
jgi:hypothetical protein